MWASLNHIIFQTYYITNLHCTQESIQEEKEQDANETSSPVVASHAVNLSSSLEFTAGSDTIFPHLRSTTTAQTPHSKTPDRHGSAPGSTSRSRLEQTTESLSYSPDIAARTSPVLSREMPLLSSSTPAPPPILEPNENDCSGDYSNEFDGAEVENLAATAEAIDGAHDDEVSTILAGRSNHHSHYHHEGEDDDHDMYRDFTPSPASAAAVEVVTTCGDDNLEQAAVPDDDMFNYTWDEEAPLDSPVRSTLADGAAERLELKEKVKTKAGTHHQGQGQEPGPAVPKADEMYYDTWDEEVQLDSPIRSIVADDATTTTLEEKEKKESMHHQVREQEQEQDPAVTNDDDMYHDNWDEEVPLDSPTYNGATSVDEGKATSTHHNHNHNGQDDISISEEQMMMELPSIVRGDEAALQHGHYDEDTDEYYDDYNEFNITHNSDAAVLDHDLLYDLDPFD